MFYQSLHDFKDYLLHILGMAVLLNNLHDNTISKNRYLRSRNEVHSFKIAFVSEETKKKNSELHKFMNLSLKMLKCSDINVTSEMFEEIQLKKSVSIL